MRITSLIFLLFFIGVSNWSSGQSFKMPQHYTAHKTMNEITIDGKGDEESWQKAFWSNSFVDIEGNDKPKPYRNTKVKMLWDQNYFYFLASMEEPHIWAKLTERDAVIFHDNDFEIFIDPDGDTHNYMEFEVNAFNTVWDLLLTRPYRDGGRAINGWDIKGLKSAVHIDGSINDPSDTDKGWSAEVAIPWKMLKEITGVTVPPRNGNQWRVNFSRVQWETEISDGEYIKKKDPDTGKNLPENNWVWSPQGKIAMHEPEFWGVVSFSSLKIGGPKISIGRDQEAEEIRQALYKIHRAQILYKKKHTEFSSQISALNLGKILNSKGYEIKVDLENPDHLLAYDAAVFLLNKGWWRIDQTGRIWFQKVKN